MSAYSGLNWWSGNLRPYESYNSFVARFGALNGLSEKQCWNFLEQFRNGRDSYSLAPLAQVLMEPIQVVNSVFGQHISLEACEKYRLPNLGRRGGLSYCPHCVCCGYHSYLHEIAWLIKCPFHGTPIVQHTSFGVSKTTAVENTKRLRSLMETVNADWPRASSEQFAIHKLGCLKMLSKWCDEVTLAAQEMSLGEIWHAESEIYLDYTFDEAMGMLRQLTPMPERIKSLLLSTGHEWTLSRLRLPPRAFASLRAKIPFDIALDYYKVMRMLKGGNTPFGRRVKWWKAALRERHGTCRCAWGRTASTWNQMWLPTPEDEFFSATLECPFEIALRQLDQCAGGSSDDINSGTSSKTDLKHIELCRAMYDVGMVKWPKEFTRSAQMPMFFPTNLLHLVWRGNAELNLVLDALAIAQVDRLGADLTTWLDAIDRGEHPGRRHQIVNSTRLRMCDSRLELISWSRNGVGQPSPESVAEAIISKDRSVEPQRAGPIPRRYRSTLP